MPPKRNAAFRKFIREPLRDKNIEELPGVYAILQLRLEAAGITKVKHLLGHYLIHRRNYECFREVLWDLAAMPHGSSFDTSETMAAALEEWCLTNL